MHGEEEMNAGSWWGQLKERDHVEDLNVNGRTILKLIFKPLDGGNGRD
jgi:uncharacterized protein YcaQ